jgi:nucleotide-binding universal stress UspA family protein
LCCYDGSEAAGHAIERAGTLVEAGRRAIVLTVWQPAPPLHLPGDTTSTYAEIDAQANRRFEQRARELAEAGCTLAADAGFDAHPETRPVRGRTGATVLDAADEHGVALLTLGSRGLGGVRSALLGSVTSWLLHHSARPMLVVPPAAR